MKKSKKTFCLCIILTAIGWVSAGSFLQGQEEQKSQPLPSAQDNRNATDVDDLLFQEADPPLQGVDEIQAAGFAQADPNYVCFATAANITAEAILQAMNKVTPYLFKEIDIDYMLGDYFVSKRAPRIPCWDTHHGVAVGENTTQYDHEATNKVVFPGDLVIIDTGARYIYACSDVARTFPVGLKFKTNTQRVYYYLALNAMKLGERLATRNVGKMSLDQIDIQMRAFLAKSGLTNVWWRFYHYIGTGSDVHGASTGWDPYSPIQPGQFFALEVLFPFTENGKRFGIHIEDTFAVLYNQVVRLSAKCPRDIDPAPIAPPETVSQ